MLIGVTSYGCEMYIMKGKISIYVRNSSIGPSDYYRICQYIDCISYDFVINDALTREEFQKNINLKSGIRKQIYQGYLFIKIYLRRAKALMMDLRQKRKAIVVQREIFPHLMGWGAGYLLKKLCRYTRVIWDFDDDVFLNNEISDREKKILEEYAYKIVVTSAYLKGLLSEKAQEKVIVLPTTDSFYKRYNPIILKNKRLLSYCNKVEIVWVGTAVNLKNLDIVIEELEKAAEVLEEKYSKKLILKVVCNEKYEYNTCFLQIKNLKWSRGIAEESIANAHIGIMPLSMNKYALGKGGFKLIQYISVGLPVIASSVGYNEEIVSNNMGVLIRNEDIGRWMESILMLSIDEKRWMEMGEAAFDTYMEKYSYDNNLDVWKSILKE